MIDRGLLLLEVLADKAGDAPPVARRLLAAIAPPVTRAAVADALVRALETLSLGPARARVQTTWIWTTSVSAAAAAVLAVYPLLMLSRLFENPAFEGVYFLPLGALPFAALALARWRRARRTEDDAAAQIIAAELRKVSIDGALAEEVGCFVAGCEPRVIVEPVSAFGASVFPAVAAMWTIFTFWVLYFLTAGEASW